MTVKKIREALAMPSGCQVWVATTAGERWRAKLHCVLYLSSAQKSAD
jgi:hypothetical protein